MVVSIASGCEIVLSGRLDVHAVAEVRTALQAAIDARAAGRRMVLRDAGPRLMRILRATRLHRMLTIAPAETAGSEIVRP